MKPLKSKKAMLASIILASVALGGVGFSAWVINASNQIQDLNNVKVDVGNFNDNRFTLSVPTLSDGKVVFDWDGTSGELVGGSGENTEDLEFTFSTTLTGSVGQLDGINLQLKTNASLSTLLGSEGTKATIQSPLEPGAEATEIIPGEAFTNPTGQAVQSDAKFANASGATKGGSKWSYTVKSAGNSSYTISVTVNFAWGELFKYANPTKITGSVTDEQITGLKALAALHQNGINLEFVVGAIAKAA